MNEIPITTSSTTVSDPNVGDSAGANDLVAITLAAGDIADGQRGVTNRCPVALAVRRATGIKSVSIRNTQGVLYGNEYRSFDLPAEAREFIAAFDAGQAVKPLVFDIRLMPYRTHMPYSQNFPGQDFPGEATA